MDPRLAEAVAKLKAGDKPGAQRTLAEILKNDPNNDDAWLWMSGAVPEERRRYCIDRALSINPDNQHAQMALATLDAAKGAGQVQMASAAGQEQISTPAEQIIPTVQEQVPAPADRVEEVATGLEQGFAAPERSKTPALTGQEEWIAPTGQVQEPAPAEQIVETDPIDQAHAAIFAEPSELEEEIGQMDEITPAGEPEEVNSLWQEEDFALEDRIEAFAATGEAQSQTDAEQFDGFAVTDEGQLPAAEPLSEPLQAEEIPVTPGPSAFDSFDLEPFRQESRPSAWIDTQGKTALLVFLDDETLVSGIVPMTQIKQIQASFKVGVPPVELLPKNTVIPLADIQEVREKSSSVIVTSRQGAKKQENRLKFHDRAVSRTILDNLEQKLGTSFTRSSRPTGVGSRIVALLVLLVLLLACVGFFYLEAQQLEAGQSLVTGNAQVRSIIAMVGLLGTTGVLVIGGILVLLLVTYALLIIIKPPRGTTLERVKEAAK